MGHTLDAMGEIIIHRSLRRREVLPFFGGMGPCLVGMEACATTHYWAREIARPGHGAADAAGLRAPVHPDQPFRLIASSRSD